MEEEEPLQPQGRPTRPRRNRPLTRQALEEMLTLHPQDILSRLASEGGGLGELVTRMDIDNERIRLLLLLLHRCFIPENLLACHAQIRCIIDKMLETEFLIFSVLKFLMEAAPDDRVVAGALALVEFALIISPVLACPKVAVFPARLREMLRGSGGGSALTLKLERIDAGIKRLRSQMSGERSQQGEGSCGTRFQADEARAGETFRALTLIPAAGDLTADEQIFIRRSRDSGRYDDLEDYLDVQFRLFRADLMIPLRESIEKYLGTHGAETSREGGRGVRVYRDVQIMRPVCTDRDLAYRISFDVSCFPSVDWRTTQRLKYGSLLCLSSDGFQSYLCAMVREHDATLLVNGLVDVVFVLERRQLGQVTEIPRDRRFIMVESPAYFEAYRHVLQGLKNLNDHNFPFVRYIVECQNEIHTPVYLREREGERRVKYDFRPLLDDNFVIKDEEDRVGDALADLGLAAGDIDAEEIARNMEEGGAEVMSPHSWPAHDDLKLDDSQYRALHNALTKELAMVQGPPGTGKTYLGLKILKMLLHNTRAWNDPDHKRPLLIVCYTNHALDQFLEGVLDFFQGSLVRVGGRSKSDRLAEVNLTNYRKRAKINQKIPMEVYEARLRSRLELQKLKLVIHEKAAQLEIAEQEIVKEDFMKDFISSSALEEFKRCFRRGEEGSGMLKWLKLEAVHERLKHQAEHRATTLPPFQAVAQASSQGAPFVRPLDYEFDDDDEIDDEDDDTFDISSSLRDNILSRKLDIDEDDDDDFLFQDLGIDDIALDREETEMERLRRRQREMEAENQLLRLENVALDVSNFCSAAEDARVQDRTVAKPNKAKDREVGENLKKLTQQYQRRLQALLKSVDKMEEEEEKQVQSVWKLKPKDRWRLYRRWTDLFCRQTRGELREQEEQYFDLTRKYREILDQEDRSILEKQTVIGMTTTGAARYQALLQTIGPRVILVEEAAEVFEAHVIATLSAHCQHLILIGDHKQLRPSPTVYELAKKGGLDVSLFERMVRNNFHVDCLRYQHRMRPEISRMMRLPDLYPQLQDHDVVKNMPAVKGVRHNAYYISHYSPEDRDEETKSYSNRHEAEFLAALSDYLLKQGYHPGQITILTPYSGQIRVLGQELKRRKVREGVRLSSVDNYQGEENDVVLLSLVRSNNDNDIGFLKFDNRICVALSRAKMGLYVIGNFEVLQSSSDLLRQVVDHAQAQGILGDGLPLTCQNHLRERGILACTADDFKKTPEGGCGKRCDIRLPCGHQCASLCHTSGHQDAVCPMPCARRCPICKQACKEGDHACCEHTHCLRWTEKVIPRCQHLQGMPCGVEADEAQCQEPCPQRLPCGHQCQNQCGQPCTLQCKAKVEVKGADCGHQHDAPCWEKDSAECSVTCGAELLCGHTCGGSCGECRRGRLHAECGEKCRRILVCGHGCPSSCCQCLPCTRQCENRCIHSRCDKPCGDACVPCAMPCQWQCRHHKCRQLCGDPCDRARCQEPCPKRLAECGHPCPGLCGEMCPPPPYCLICHPEAFKDLPSGDPERDDHFVYLEDCNHIIEASFLDRWVDQSRDFQPAEEEEETDAQGHAECSVSTAAGDVECSVSTGEEATAAAGAVGGREESGGEEARRSRLVKFPTCPKCTTPIRRNLRYGNVIKEALTELEFIKQRCRGDAASVDDLQGKVEAALRRAQPNLRAKLAAVCGQTEVKSETHLRTQFYHVSLALDLSRILLQVSSAVARWPDKADTYRAMQRDLDLLLTWALTPRLIVSDQQHFDTRQEFQLLTTVVRLLYCRDAISEDGLEVEPRIMRHLASVLRQLMTGAPVAENVLEEGRALLEELKDVVTDPYSALTDQEREEIVKAVSLPTGSWYACPRGHYYVIGECGRPAETASCPECRAPVGGEGHALTEGNRPAPEFDNAEGPRWTVEDDEQLARQLMEEEWLNWH